MDIPSLFMIPSAVSSGKVHSVFPNSTDADFDFNRDSSATRVNSQGLIEEVGYFGSELVTNGTFDTDSDWGKGSGWTISGGKANRSAESGNSPITQNVPVVNGRKYTFSYTRKYLSGSSGHTNIFVKLDNVNYSTIGAYISTVVEEHTVTGEFTALFTGNLLWQVYGIGDFTGYVDNVSIKEIIGDRARLNYEIEGGLVNTKPSLLLEPQSTNLVTYSEDFSNSYWTKTGATVESGFVSPDGTANAYKFVEGANNGIHFINRTLTVQNATIHTASIFVKSAERTKFGMRDGFSNKWITINLSSSSVIASNGLISSKVTKLTNDWHKISFTFTTAATSATFKVYTLSDSYTSGSPETYSYQGDGLSGVYIWGAQLEQLSYATSYIPTNGSTQTRAAETCNGAGTSSILPSEEGILYTEIAALSTTDPTHQNRDISISDGTINNTLILYYQSSLNRISVYINVGNVMVALGSVTSYTVTNFNKIAVRWKQNDFRMYINGTLVFSDTSGASFSSGTLNRINFDNAIGNDDFYGKIRDIRVYNTKEMTDSEVDILLTKITS